MKIKKEETKMYEWKKKRFVGILVFLSFILGFIFLLSSCGGSCGNNVPSNTYLLSG